MPSKWITGENACMLVQLCRHVIYARGLAREITELQRSTAADEREHRLALMRLHVQQSQSIANLATKLRLTNQSRATNFQARTQAARAGTAATRPWDTDDVIGDRRQ
jgi:hypothetical protein